MSVYQLLSRLARVGGNIDYATDGNDFVPRGPNYIIFVAPKHNQQFFVSRWKTAWSIMILLALYSVGLQVFLFTDFSLAFFLMIAKYIYEVILILQCLLFFQILYIGPLVLNMLLFSLES